MGYIQNRVAGFAQLPNDGENTFSRVRVYPCCRLVEEDHPRPVYETHREIEPAFHSSRKRCDVLVAASFEADKLQQLVDAILKFYAFDIIDAPKESQI